MAPASADGALADLDRLITRLTPVLGPARRRQLSWLRGELALYQAWVPAADLPSLLEAGYLRGYLAAADRGMLRTRGATGDPSPPGTGRVRRACLHLLAQYARLPRPDLGPAPFSTPREKVPTPTARRAMTLLASQARQPQARPGIVRAALVAALVHHHDLRTGEIADLRLGDLAPIPDPDRDEDQACRTLLTYRPAAPGVGPGTPTTITLQPLVSTLLDLWVEARSHLAHLVHAPQTNHLLVSVHGNHIDGVRTPPGLPLRPRGLVRAHATVIAELNQVLHDRHGHEPDYAPLPRTLGELRPMLPSEDS